MSSLASELFRLKAWINQAQKDASLIGERDGHTIAAMLQKGGENLLTVLDDLIDRAARQEQELLRLKSAPLTDCAAMDMVTQEHIDSGKVTLFPTVAVLEMLIEDSGYVFTNRDDDIAAGITCLPPSDPDGGSAA